MLTTVLQTIGNTPMLRLDLSRDLPGTVWLKLENRNPGGSIKDRVAFYLIERALENGELEPDACWWRPPAAIWASAWPWSRPCAACVACSPCRNP